MRVVPVSSRNTVFFYQSSATSLALHYLNINRTSPSDLKAIVVMGSMGRYNFLTLSAVSNACDLSVLEVHSNCPHVQRQ